MSNERVITASEGMMLTNGEIYASSVRLGDWDSADNWHEVSKEEYEMKMAEMASDAEVMT
jgi:hypothetical protein